MGVFRAVVGGEEAAGHAAAVGLEGGEDAADVMVHFGDVAEVLGGFAGGGLAVWRGEGVGGGDLFVGGVEAGEQAEGFRGGHGAEPGDGFVGDELA